MAYRPPHTPGTGNFNVNGNQHPRPGNAQFAQTRPYTGVAPQRYPMMQPGMGPGGYTPQMYQGQVPPQQQHGVMGMGHPSAMGYNPQQTQQQQMMNQAQQPQQQYPNQQMQTQQQGMNPMLEQQKRMAEAQQKMTEKQKKERYVEEQRRKLRQFSKGGTAALGTSKLDFDNLLGTSGKETGKGTGSSMRPMQPAQLQHKGPQANPPQPAEDDSFGDFLQGPTTAPVNQPNIASPVASGTEDDFGDFLQGPTGGGVSGESVVVPQSQPERIENTPKPTDSKQGTTGQTKEDVNVSEQMEQVPTKPAGPTLESMMLASTDFTTDKSKKVKAKKQTLRDSNLQQKPSTKQHVFEASQKSRTWNSDQTFSNLFSHQPPPVAGGDGSASSVQQGGAKVDAWNLPAWCTNETAIPVIYRQVLEASMQDGAIQTELVYPILILSGLDKTVLGHIWNMCNRTTPGRLTRQELFFALGVIALAQNGQPINAEVLGALKEAPIPNLTPPQGQTVSQTSTGSFQPPTSSTVVSSAAQDEDDDFAAFQAAPTMGEASFIPATTSLPMNTNTIPPQPSTISATAAILLPISSSSGGSTISSTVPSIGSSISALSPGSGPSISATASIPVPSSSIPTLSFSTPSGVSGVGRPMTAMLSSGGIASKLGDMGKIEDIGYDARYPKEEENCYIFAGSPPESGSSGRSSPMVWDPNCIYDKLTIRSKDDSESTSSLSDRTPIDDEDEEEDVEEHFADFKTASNTDDFSGFRMAGQDDDGFVFEKVKIKAAKNNEERRKGPPNIPPPKRAGAKDDFNLRKSSDSRSKQAAPKLSKFASFDSSVKPPSVSLGGFTKPPAGNDDEFSDFKKASSHGDAFHNSPKKSVSVTDFTAFQSSKAATPASASTTAPQISFADFSQFKHSASESDLMGMTPGQDDKYAALRSLTSDNSASQPEFGIGLAATPEELLDDDDFEDFQQATVPAAVKIDEDFDDFQSVGALGGMIQSDIPPSSLEDSFAEFQQADPVPKPAHADIFGTISDPNKTEPSMDLFSKPVAPSLVGNMGIKPISAIGGSTLLSMNPPQPSNSWLDNVHDREPPPDDDFGDFQTTSELAKNNPDSLSVGKSDDSGSLNDFKKASASDLYGMEFDGFGSTVDDDVSRPALNLDDLGTPDETPAQVDPATLFNSHTSGKLPKVNNIASLDLTTLDLDLGTKPADKGKENRSDSFGDFNSAPVMMNMDTQNQSNAPNSGALVLSNTPLMPQGSALIGDRYSQVSGEIQNDNRHAQEWKRCLASCHAAIKKANNVFNGISSSTVCNEVIRSTEGSEYLTAVIEIYRVACRIITSMKAMGAETDELQNLEKDIDLVWNNLSAFLAASPLQPDDGSFVFKTAILKPEPANRDRACGVCLLSVDSRSKAFDHSKDNHKLSYGGRQYHATCANLWVNMVDSILPALPLNSLL